MTGLIFLYFVTAEAIINPYGPTIVNDFSNCIIQIIESDFTKPGLLIMADNNNVSTPVTKIRNNLLSYVHKSLKFSVQIQVTHPEKEAVICEDDKTKNVLKRLDLFRPIPIADYIIVIIDDDKDLYSLASKLIHSRTWNPLAKFIVLLFHFTDTDRVNEEIIENIFTCLFKYNVINIIILVPQATKIRNAIVYGWRPYDPPKYCGYSNETAKNRIRKENICEKGKLTYKRSVFEGRTPEDMKGCTLHIIALERQPFVSNDKNDPNIEMYLVREVIKGYNFTLNYEIINANRGQRDTGEWDGALKELLSKRGNVLLGGIFPDFDVHEDFECSTTYLADSYSWVVPRAYPSPRWIALIIIFKQFVWVSVIIAFIVCVGAWKVIGLMSDESAYNQRFSHCFLNTWICTLGFCTYTRPKTSGLRTFFVFLNLYCVTCLTAYQTKLIDVLTNPTFEYQIQTVEELINSGLKFGGFEELHDLFFNSSDPLDSYIGEQWVIVDDISDAMVNVAVHRNFSLLCSRLQLAHLSAIMPELSDSLGKLNYYVFRKNVFSVPLEMLALKGFPFMHEFSETLGLLKQCGINAALKRYFEFFNLRRRANLLRFMSNQQVDIDALSLQHLQGGFSALILGYTLGALTLAFEFILNTRLVKEKITKSKKT